MGQRRFLEEMTLEASLGSLEFREFRAPWELRGESEEDCLRCKRTSQPLVKITEIPLEREIAGPCEKHALPQSAPRLPEHLLKEDCHFGCSISQGHRYLLVAIGFVRIDLVSFPRLYGFTSGVM